MTALFLFLYHYQVLMGLAPLYPSGGAEPRLSLANDIRILTQVVGRISGRVRPDISLTCTQGPWGGSRPRGHSHGIVRANERTPRRAIVFADREEAGLEAARKLTAEVDGSATAETQTPAAPANDWADVVHIHPRTEGLAQ